ncbi:hypothetical protein ACFV2X_40055 [Streptomyces sp. NPDC059679]|uniref:hypothetical protein n=1 Tax=Streptomyces sp. NPDC059679 TaxID=3346903 RepID=UPI0036C62B9C
MATREDQEGRGGDGVLSPEQRRQRDMWVDIHNEARFGRPPTTSQPDGGGRIGSGSGRSADAPSPSRDRPVTEPPAASGHRGSGSKAGDEVRESSSGTSRPSGETVGPKAGPQPPSAGDSGIHSARTPDSHRHRDNTGTANPGSRGMLSSEEAGQGLSRYARDRGMPADEARAWGEQFSDAHRAGDSAAQARVQEGVHDRLRQIDATREGSGTVRETGEETSVSALEQTDQIVTRFAQSQGMPLREARVWGERYADARGSGSGRTEQLDREFHDRLDQIQREADLERRLNNRPGARGNTAPAATGGGKGDSTLTSSTKAPAAEREQVGESAPGERPAVSAVPVTTPGTSTTGPATAPAEDSTSSDPARTPPHATHPGTDTEEGGRTSGQQESGEVPVTRPGTYTAPTTGIVPAPAVPAPSQRHPGAARFDIDAARARLDDPAVAPERREESVLWAERAVLDRIQHVAPDENPMGVVARPEEVVELVASEHLRAGHLPATALLGSLIQGPAPTAQPAPQPRSRPAPQSEPEPEAIARPQPDSEQPPTLPAPDVEVPASRADQVSTSVTEPTAVGSDSPLVAASSAETVLPGSSDESPESSSSAVPGSAGEGEDRLGSESEGPDVLFAPPARGAGLDPIRDWPRISESGGSRRSSALRAIDRAVSRLPRDAGTEDLRRVLVSVTEWKSDKGPESRRWDAVSRLEAAVRDRMDQLAPPARVSVRDRVEQRASGRTPVRGGYSAQPGPSSRRGEPPVVAPLVSAAPGAVEGFGPASGLEAELHRYRVELPRGAEVEEFGDIVELPGLLTITLDKAGGVPVPEIVTKPARGLARGPADGRAERSEVHAAVNDVMSRLRHARPGARIGQIFPESAGYVVDPLAEDLPVRINEAGYATLVHHTATAPTSRLVAFIEHVRGRMRRESPPVQIAHADAGAGLAFGAWARQDFARWLSQYPRWADAANPWDGDELEGVIALGYTQVAATVRGATLDRTQRPKDLTAVASRDSLAALRSSLGEGLRAYLEHRARSIAARFAETVVRGGSVLDLPLTMSRGLLRATVGQYLDNLLLHRPERFVSQYEALGIRTDFRTLDANPDRRGRALIVPAVVRLEARSYASMEQTPQTIERDSDTLAVLSLNLYNEARLDHGLPPVGRPLAPAQPDFLFAPPATTAPSVRPAGSTVPAGPAPAPAPSPTPLPPALVETVAGLVAMDADARARELASLPWRDRELLAANRAFVEQLRAGLSVEDFTAVATRLLVVVPDGVEQPEAAREEAEALVADMLADPQIAVALLTGGRRLVVVPRNRPMTSLEEFAGLKGRHHPGGDRSFDVARGLFDRRRGLVGVGEENLLGESTDVLGDDFYDDGYSVARHEWAHAIESVLSAEDRQLIRDVFEAKVAAVPAAQWPDGPVPNHSSSNAHEYFAQLSNAYLGANTGKDSNSRRRPRNNGSDWVEQHDPALLPLLRRLYGPGRPSNLGSRDNPYILTGFRQLWDRAEGELTGRALEEPEAELPTPPARQSEAPEAPEPADAITRPLPVDVGALLAPPTTAPRPRPLPVSAMMTEREFKQSTAAPGLRSSSRIADIDEELRAFHALPGSRQGARLLALKAIAESSRAYVAHKQGEGSRVEGTQRLAQQAEAAMRQLNPENVFRDLLTEIDGALRAGKNPDLDVRSPAGEAQKAAQAVPSDRFHAMMSDYVHKLGRLRDDRTLPAETRAVIEELMAVEPLVTVMQYPRGGMPGIKLNSTGDGAEYTFNVDPQVRGGTSFLLGHIAHEFTHVVAHQAFGSSPVMELVRSGATDAEVGALAAERRRTLNDLKTALAGDREFSEFQQTMLQEKLVYGAQPRTLERYAYNFERSGKITTAQKERLVGWGKAAGDASGTLVEYDTVLNQMLIYLHMWQTSQNNPFYVRLRAAAQAAYERRSDARGRGESSSGEPILFAPPSSGSGSRSARRSPGPTLITFDDEGEADEVAWSQVEGASWYRRLPSVQRRRLRATEDYTPLDEALDRMRNTVVAAVDGGAGREDVSLLADLYERRGNLSAFDPVMQAPLQQSVRRRTGSRELSLVRGSVTGFGRHVAYTDVIVPHPGPWAMDSTAEGLAAALEHVLGAHSTATVITDNEMRGNSQSGELRRNIDAINARNAGRRGYVPLVVEVSALDTWYEEDNRRWVTTVWGVPMRLRHQSPFAQVTVTRGSEASAGPSTGPGESWESADVLLAPAPLRAGQTEETTRPAAVEAQAPNTGQRPLSQEEQLAERGLTPVYVLPGGDVLAHALTAVAPAESGRLAGHSWPAGPEELRAALADALAADLGLPPDEQRLWSAVAGQTGPSGAPLVTAFGGSADEAVRALRTGSGPEATDWLTLAVAAPVLGLRLTVLTPDGSLWTTGPETGRPVALLQQEDPAPYTARWAATEPTAQARQARRPDVSQLAGTSGYSWGTTSADSSTSPGTPTRAAATAPSSTAPADPGARTGGSPARPTAAASGDSARPAVFFGSEPRPSTPDSKRAGTSSGAPVTRTPPAQVAETSEVSAPVAESALTPPLAEETATHPRTARDTRDGQDTDAVTILDVPADDGMDVVPAVPAEEEPPRTLSPYALTYGARFDGSVGLALYEPLSEDVLGALHQQVLDGLGVEPGSAADGPVREELAAVLSQSEIARELPQVRSARGHRVTVTVDGQERTIDVRLRLTDPELSSRAGTSGEVPRRTTLERQGEGGQSSSRSSGSGTMRTVPIPWIGIYDGPAGPLRWFDGALVLSLTHNQSSESSTVSDGLTARSMQRANDPAHAVQYTSRWQIRIDTDRNAPVDAWSPERVGGPLTVWFPEHRVFGDGGAGPLPEPAGLGDLPLWGVDEVLDPGRLLDELRADEGFTVLNNLGADSHEELEEFLSERTLRGGLPMMRDGGVHSPVLFDRHGDSLGVLRLEATVLPQRPAAGTPDGKFSLESWLTQSSGVEQSSRLTSGVALDGSGGPMFTPDHEVGHPDAARLMGGSIMAKAGVSWQSGDALNTSSSVALMHALYTTSSHLVTPADITYRVTLIRSGGGEITGSFGPWPDGVSLRLPQRSTTTGHVPTPEERRRLPEHLENLESIGYSAVPVAPEGTGPMFDRAETWLRREGFLPPAERESVFNETRAEQQLENLRRFAQLRSRLGQAAAMPDAVDGGRPLWFELPDHVSGGTRRVQLRFSATRDRTPPGAQAEAGLPPAAHVRRLPDVDTVTFLSLEARGGRQRSNQFGGTVGAGGGPRFPVDGGAAALDATGDYTWGRRHETATSAGSASGVDPFNITLDAGTELFEIPALFTLDLYEGTAEEPTVRFAAEPTPEPALGADPAAIQPAVPAPPFATGRVRLVVPHHRTFPWDSRPVVSAAPHRVRAPITGGGQDDDHVRLGLTDEAGRPREGLLRLPDDANVDVFRGSAALQEAFRQIVTGTYPGHPAVGTFGQWAEAAASRLPGAVTGPGNRLWEYLTGTAVEDQQAFAGEALFQQLRVASLLARAGQIFNGGYVMEGLTLPGLLADQELSVEIAGYLHHPTYHGSYNTYTESNLAAKDTSAQGRSVTTSHQYGGGLGALQSPPPPASDGTPQRASLANPSVRGAYTHRTARTSERSASSSVVRTPTQAAEHHLIGADATLLVTLRQGTRNVAMNVAGRGGREDITLAIDLPRAVRFQLSDSQLVRFEHWFTGVVELPRPVVQPDTVPLPEHYVVSGDIGFASVLSVTQLDDPIRRNESRDRLRRELLTLVEREAPGVTRPGHFAYRMGVAARIADMTSPAGLRALPGRRRVSLWFRHAGRHGSRLVEVALSAEPVAQPPARREVRGRPAGAGVGIDQIASHAPGNRSESETVTRSLQVSANPISRYPRPQARSGRTDRTGPVLSGTGTRGRSSRTARAAQDTYWARTENAADFDDIGYTITATVRAELLQDWPPDLVGGALESGLLTLSDQDGGALIARIGRLLRGRPAHQVRVPVAVSLRFAGSEAVAPRRHEPAVRPRITQTDPRLPAPQAPLPLGGRTFMAGSRLIPTGATPVYGFNAFQELAEALRTVAPRLSGSWGLTADLTPEAAAFRLGELVQAGEIPVEAPRTAAGLTDTMPGAWPVESEPVTPRLQVTLHNPRPITEADDIAVDRLRVTSHSVGSSVSAESTAGLGYQWTQSGNDENMHLVSFTLPVLNRQPLSRAGGVSGSAGGWDRVKTGSSAASGTEPATRSYETMVDVVITVTGEETRYVIGSATARVYERDLLGYGVTAPRTASQVYDLSSMLSEQPNDTLRNWRTHPVTELPAVLARGLDERENAAQLWLHLGADPDGTALARALYVGSRTAVAAGRPVELVVRGATGLRFWPFGADGSLVDLTPATQDTWNRLRAAIVTATDATAAEADQVARETELVPREAEAESRLADSRRELTTATEARDAAAAAHATARSARGSLADRLRDAEAARAAAEEEAAPHSAAVTTAEQRLAQTEQAVLDARREVDQEAAQLRLLTADGHEPTPQAGPGPRAALAEARAERDSARGALGRAQGMADVARRAVDRATERVGDLRDRLAAADNQMREAATRERDAEDAVIRATSARDQHYRDHRQLQEELRDVRRQQADQQRLWEDAWRAMPGQSGMLSADRCREGVGGARYPLGSLS